MLKSADGGLRAVPFPVDDPEWRKWMNVHRYTRQGVSFQEMTEAQRTVAFGLLRAALSASGPRRGVPSRGSGKRWSTVRGT